MPRTAPSSTGCGCGPAPSRPSLTYEPEEGEGWAGAERSGLARALRPRVAGAGVAGKGVDRVVGVGLRRVPRIPPAPLGALLPSGLRPTGGVRFDGRFLTDALALDLAACEGMDLLGWGGVPTGYSGSTVFSGEPTGFRSGMIYLLFGGGDAFSLMVDFDPPTDDTTPSDLPV